MKTTKPNNMYVLGLRIFGKTVKKFKYVFEPLRNKLKIARMGVPVESYAAYILFLGLIVFIFGFIFFSIFGSLILGFSIIGLFVFLLLSFALGMGVVIFMYLYPSMVTSERGGKLDNSLAFVSIYLSTISKSGFPPQHMFKLLSEFKEYGIASEESKKIHNDIEGLGLDLPSALSRAMSRSPSVSWTELLSGLRNSITVGGEVSKYLEEKAKGFVQDYRRKLENFAKILSLFMNMYITIIIVGTIFFVIVSSLMATVGGVSPGSVRAMHYLIVFLGLPLITAGFIMMIKSSSPWSN